MPTARTRKLATALTVLLLSSLLAGQASATESGFTASAVKQQGGFKGERHVGSTGQVGLTASGAASYRVICVETSIHRYDPYFERIATVDTKVVCH